MNNSTNPTRVLVVDDDTKLCRLVRDYLAPFGYVVVAAHDGASGLEEARTGRYGILILDVILERLFEPFYRPDHSRTRDTGGVGLGLAIVKSCILGCGGEVSLHSCAPHGLEVRIQLRAAR